MFRQFWQGRLGPLLFHSELRVRGCYLERKELEPRGNHLPPSQMPQGKVSFLTP